jgi:hypothetical protein
MKYALSVILGMGIGFIYYIYNKSSSYTSSLLDSLTKPREKNKEVKDLEEDLEEEKK